MCSVVGRTKDHANEKTWRMSALPNFCDDAMVERRLLKRHFAYFGRPAAHVSWEWHYCNEEDERHE